MRRLFLIVPVLLVAAGVWAVASGQDQELARWAAGWQREFQNALAGGLRALRAGEPGAVAALLGLCFAYGFFHALGPGHGKFLIGGYGVSHDVPLLRLSTISLLSSLGQAVTAVLLVLTGLFLLGWTRTRLTDTAETIMLPLSAAAIGLIGVWLALRGARRLWRLRPSAHTGHDHACHAGCTHRHGPSVEEVRHAGGLRDALALIGGIAIRPCSGAILLLVLTWHMGILAAGIAGTFAMATGTAALTILVAASSVFVRRSTLLSLAETRHAAYVLPAIEVLAGAAILLLSVQMAGLAA
ncbi:membrane protein, putative [Oceanicola granulosus HTCC2516]|uniref:Nickel/cobalt efflux system n=1 Tax=Oceanicola granulosus (strain ATCC BAA-861 / DSM 15982 / KCTC 12143 / HTCC2516) TaxID=314256 RepID=Q2CF21_OCEGH|nr:membrane protein [Oceanicola granulosus]EAR51306.1 membrane protein, putative [Oceanicola granulosus HTCC2516]